MKLRGDLGAVLGVLATSVVLASGCGDESGGGNASPGDGDCLTAEEVQREINEIAGGIEASEEEVQAKQDAIRQIRAREC